MGRDQQDYDPRIAMAPGWRPPLPKNFGKRRRWPRRFALAVLLVVGLPLGALAAAEWMLGLDPHLPSLERAARPPRA
jgi:hypothetical protein